MLLFLLIWLLLFLLLLRNISTTQRSAAQRNNNKIKACKCKRKSPKALQGNATWSNAKPLSQLKRTLLADCATRRQRATLERISSLFCRRWLLSRANEERLFVGCFSAGRFSKSACQPFAVSSACEFDSRQCARVFSNQARPSRELRRPVSARLFDLQAAQFVCRLRFARALQTKRKSIKRSFGIALRIASSKVEQILRSV